MVNITLADNLVKIPKVIFQTCKNKENIPTKWQPSVDAIDRFMPDWKHVIMDDKDNREFVATHFPDYLSTFDNFEYPIQRADAIRYMWLYVNGGLYMDCDIEILGDISFLFREDTDLYLICSGNVGSVITNSFMASKPGCRVWLEMLEETKKEYPWWAFLRHWKVMTSTGPVALDRVIKRGDYTYLALPKKLLMPCSICEGENCTKDGAVVRHLPGSSWTGFDTTVFNFCLCNWQWLIGLLILIFILLLLYWFFHKHPRCE